METKSVWLDLTLVEDETEKIGFFGMKPIEMNDWD